MQSHTSRDIGFHLRSGSCLPDLLIESAEAFAPVRNSQFCRPLGGLMLRPAAVPGEPGAVRLRDDTTVAVIDSSNDWATLASVFRDSMIEVGAGRTTRLGLPTDRLDFEKLANRFDAFWLTAAGIESCSRHQPGVVEWDGEAVLLLREDALA